MAVVQLPLLKRVRILCLALVLGAWIAMKASAKRLWKNKVVTGQLTRSDPPSLLVDSALGRHSYIKTKGVKLHYVETGPAGAPPVLMLHGFPDCWAGWRAQLGKLGGQHGRRVLALDLQGCGDSDKPRGRSNYRPEELLAPIVRLLQTLKAAPPHKPAALLGHDLGGLIGWYLVHEFPELIDRFAVISAPHPNIFWDSLPLASPFNSSWMYAAQLPWLPEHEAMASDAALVQKCHPHLRPTSPVLEAYKYVFSRTEDWTGAINYFRSLIFWRIDECQGQVRPPVLLITGNKDPQVSLEAVVRSSEYCRQATVKIVEGAGHYPHVESPDHVNRLLEDFFEDGIAVNRQNGSLSGGGARALVGRVLGAVHLFT